MNLQAPPAVPDRRAAPSFAEAFRFWVKLGFISFGGPTGQIAIMQTELVEKKKWISQSRFLHALNFCMLLPGPEAQQLAIYIGWLMYRVPGGIAVGALFVLPGMIAIPDELGLRWLGSGRLCPGLVLRPGVGGAGDRAASRGADRLQGAGDRVLVGIAALAFVAVFFGAPFPPWC